MTNHFMNGSFSTNYEFVEKTIDPSLLTQLNVYLLRIIQSVFDFNRSQVDFESLQRENHRHSIIFIEQQRTKLI